MENIYKTKVLLVKSGYYHFKNMKGDVRNREAFIRNMKMKIGNIGKMKEIVSQEKPRRIKRVMQQDNKQNQVRELINTGKAEKTIKK